MTPLMPCAVSTALQLKATQDAEQDTYIWCSAVELMYHITPCSSPSCEANISQLFKATPHVIEPKVPLLYSQQPDTCPFLSPINPIMPPIYACVFQVMSFVRISPPTRCLHFCFLLCVPRVTPISLSLICSPK